MKVLLSEHAQLDLHAGYMFYESQEPGLGKYFLRKLIADIDSLRISAGAHRRVHGCYRALSSRRMPVSQLFLQAIHPGLSPWIASCNPA